MHEHNFSVRHVTNMCAANNIFFFSFISNFCIQLHSRFNVESRRNYSRFIFGLFFLIFFFFIACFSLCVRNMQQNLFVVIFVAFETIECRRRVRIFCFLLAFRFRFNQNRINICATIRRNNRRQMMSMAPTKCAICPFFLLTFGFI